MGRKAQTLARQGFPLGVTQMKQIGASLQPFRRFAAFFVLRN